MEKNVRLSVLCEFYGKMLTGKQCDFLEDYYNNDLSLSEIAENYNITRQAVRDVLKKGENKLIEIEEKLKFLEKAQEQEKQIVSIVAELENVEENLTDLNLKNSLNKLKEKIKKLV